MTYPIKDIRLCSKDKYYGCPAFLSAFLTNESLAFLIDQSENIIIPYQTFTEEICVFWFINNHVIEAKTFLF